MDQECFCGLGHWLFSFDLYNFHSIAPDDCKIIAILLLLLDWRGHKISHQRFGTLTLELWVVIFRYNVWRSNIGKTGGLTANGAGFVALTIGEKTPRILI